MLSDVSVGEINRADEAVVNHDLLRSILARSLNLMDFDLVDQLTQDHRCQGLHFHELTDSTNKGVLRSLHRIKLLQMFTEIENLLFQSFLLRVILMRKLHKTLVGDLSVHVILVDSFVQTGHFLVTCDVDTLELPNEITRGGSRLFNSILTFYSDNNIYYCVIKE